MFLRRIVLHGFKSFADRTEFEFGAGITSIVGPNGCGKSNVVDAVRWVLGEQSAKTLRGERMTDVIFSGSRSRKPANSAEVQLHFDNRGGFLATSETDVIVARQLFRNGDSEYRLNGNACRLKDIRDLFLDTGVGVDAYSIIEQGRVDALLQASPQQRREIFEEAAGVSRYRVRRGEAQRKLERTQQNLLRVNDIVEELEKRLRSVKLAAGKARSFQQLDQRLRELKASFALAEYHTLEHARASAAARADGLRDVAGAARAELGRTDAESVALERELLQLDDDFRREDEALSQNSALRSALQERIVQAQRRAVDLDQQHTSQRLAAEQAQQRAAQLAQRFAAELGELEQLRQAERGFAERRVSVEQQQAQARQRVELARSNLADAQNLAFEAARRTSQLRSQRGGLLQQEERLTAQSGALQLRAELLESQQQESARSHESFGQRLAGLDQSIAQRQHELQQVESNLAGCERGCREIDERIVEYKQRRSALLSRLGLLEEMERRLEGVDQGTREVLAWRGSDSADAETDNIIGLVADILSVDDPRIGLLQAELARMERMIVVRDSYAFLTECARRGELAGPIRVLALDRLTSVPPTATYVDAPGVLAMASDWVRCRPEYRLVAEHLFGRIVLVDTLERGLALASTAAEGFAFVTPDGCVAHANGGITVASSKAVSGLISRKAEIRQLRGELEEAEAQLDRAARARALAAQSAADARLQRAALLDELARRQREHAELRTQLVRLDDELSRLQRELQHARIEAAQLERSTVELRSQLQVLDAACAAAEAEESTGAQALLELREELARCEAESQRVGGELTGLMVELGRTSERRSAGEHAAVELERQQQAAQQEQAFAASAAAQALERGRALQDEIRIAQRQIESAREEAQTIEAALTGLQAARSRLRRRREALGAVARRLQAEIGTCDGLVRDCELAARESEIRSEALRARIRDELAIELSEAYRGFQHESQDWDGVRTEIDELRKKIARLGHVNLDALDELAELTPRYENLAGQRQDLVSSIERLTSLIAELDQESQTRFGASFERIREQFQELFRKLFGGGKADIILEDPEQPLESGIEIIARPPGKEPQSISLLSGGEKTMTAVALLLAVFRSKPSPFALLDEVDAALDESNVGRFNSVLSEFVPASQFIVITHSKPTMRCADVLYGVTMEEPGVSRRVSVRFENRVETPVVA